MSIFKKKLVAVIALLCACVCFTALGLTASAKPEHAFADGTTLDTIDSVAIKTEYVGKDIKAFWAYISTGSFASTSNFDKAMENNNSYPSKLSKSEDPTHSFSEYAGNYSITTNYQNVSNYAGKHEHGFLMNDGADHYNSLAVLRTKYLGGDVYLRGLVAKKHYGRTTVQGGYYFALSSDGYALVRDSGAADLNKKHIISKTAYAGSITLSEDANLIVTYGNDLLSYTEGTTDTFARKCICDYYLKVELLNDDLTTTTLVDLGVSDPTTRVQSNEIVAVHKDAFVKEGICKKINSLMEVPLFFGGYDKPAESSVNKPSAKSITVGGYVGNTVEDVDLPLAYAFKDNTAVIESGTNVHAGTQKVYYEQTSDVNIKVLGLADMDESERTPYNIGDELRTVLGYESKQSNRITQSYFNRTTGISYVSDKSINDPEHAEHSKSDYDGNYTITANTVVANHVHGFTLNDDIADHNNSIITFRTKYLGGDVLLRGMFVKGFTGRTTVSGGYYFSLSNGGFKLIADSGVADLPSSEILSFTEYANSVKLSDGDNLIVTFGEDRLYYEVGPGTSNTYGQKCVCDYYIKVVKVNADGSTTTLVDRGIGNDDKIESSLLIATRAEEAGTINSAVGGIGKSIASYHDTPVFLGGYNKPIGVNGTPNVEMNIVGMEDSELSSVTVPNGYSWKYPSDKFVGGKLNYAGLTTYYNTNYEVNIKIASVTETRRVINFMNGEVAIGNVRVPVDGSYTFGVAESVSEGKVFLGWVAGDKIYAKDSTIAFANIPESGLTVQLAEIGFSLEEGAAVRYASTEYGEGGIRFIVDIDKADWEKYSAFINGFYSAIVPTDTYVVDGVLGDVSSKLNPLSIEDGKIQEVDGIVRVAFAMTDILYYNFNREFSGAAFISVKAEGGDTFVATDYNQENNSRSIYNVALELLDDHFASLNDGDEFDGTRSADELKVLNNYVKQTVDVVVTESAESVTVAKSEFANAGFHNITDDYAPYTVAVVGTPTENDGVYTITVSVTFEGGLGGEGDFSQPVVGNVWQIPVTVRVYNGSEITAVYRLTNSGAVVAKQINYADGVATITFEYTPIN